MFGSFLSYIISYDDGAVKSRPGRVRTPPGHPGSEPRGGAVMFNSLSTSLIARGILALAVGVIALA